MREAQLAGLTVLIVEDEALLRRQLAALLEKLEAEVTQAETVEAARRLSRELGFDLVLLDVNLPDGKGTTLLKERVFGEHAAVVVMTAEGNIPGAVEAMRLGGITWPNRSIRKNCPWCCCGPANHASGGGWPNTAGSRVTHTFSRNTDNVLAGENPGSKLDKARGWASGSSAKPTFGRCSAAVPATPPRRINKAPCSEGRSHRGVAGHPLPNAAGPCYLFVKEDEGERVFGKGLNPPACFWHDSGMTKCQPTSEKQWLAQVRVRLIDDDERALR